MFNHYTLIVTKLPNHQPDYHPKKIDPMISPQASKASLPLPEASEDSARAL